MIVAIIVFLILSWTFFENKLIGKLIIIPFLIMVFSIFLNYLFLLLDKERIAEIFKYVFKASFFLYWFGFLIIADYISIRDNNYILLIFSSLFWIVGIIMVRNLIFSKKK